MAGRLVPWLLMQRAGSRCVQAVVSSLRSRVTEGRPAAAIGLPQRGAGQSRKTIYLPVGLGLAAGLGSIALCQATESAPAAAASESQALPPLKPGVVVEESVYDAVELDFLSDDCEFCRMMKASPCFEMFLKFHKCSEYHSSHGEDFVSPCKAKTLALWHCIQDNPSHFPQPLVQKQDPPLPQEDKEREEQEGRRRKASKTRGQARREEEGQPAVVLATSNEGTP